MSIRRSCSDFGVAPSTGFWYLDSVRRVAIVYVRTKRLLKEDKMRVLKIAVVIGLVAVIGCGGSTAFRSGKVYYEKNQDYVKAEKMFRQAVAEEPSNWQAHLYLALSLAQQERYAEAEKSFTEARELAPEAKKDLVYQNQHAFFVDNYNKGITANSTKNYDEAVSYFKKAVEVEPGYARGHINLGVAYSMMGDEDKALESFLAAVNADPEEVEGWRNLGITYQTLKEYGKAKEAFEKVVELAPDDVNGVFALADMYFNEKEYEKALQYYDKAAETKGDDAALQYQIGAAHFSLDQFSEASMAFQKAAALSKDSDAGLYRDAMYNLAIAYLRSEEYDAGIATVERLLEMEDSSDLHEMLGRLYSKKGLKDKAIAEYERAKELSGE
jgi:tetratricopeptide (TPR) repeat protein